MLQQVKGVTLDGYDHQDVPFEQVIEALNPTPQLSHTPIFQVMFNDLQDHSTQLQLPGLAGAPLDVDNHTPSLI